MLPEHKAQVDRMIANYGSADDAILSLLQELDRTHVELGATTNALTEARRNLAAFAQALRQTAKDFDDVSYTAERLSQGVSHLPPAMPTTTATQRRKPDQRGGR